MVVATAEILRYAHGAYRVCKSVCEYWFTLSQLALIFEPAAFARAVAGGAASGALVAALLRADLADDRVGVLLRAGLAFVDGWAFFLENAHNLPEAAGLSVWIAVVLTASGRRGEWWMHLPAVVLAVALKGRLYEVVGNCVAMTGVALLAFTLGDALPRLKHPRRHLAVNLNAAVASGCVAGLFGGVYAFVGVAVATGAAALCGVVGVKPGRVARLAMTAWAAAGAVGAWWLTAGRG